MSDPGRPRTDGEGDEHARIQKHPLAKRVVREFMVDVRRMTTPLRPKKKP
jgi:hypothetical protein